MSGKVHSIRKRLQGWGTTEYLAVLVGLMTVWYATQVTIERLQRKHADFLWTLMLPY